MKHSRFRTWLMVLVAVPLLSGCGGFMSWFHARDNMNNGVRAFRETNYSSAAGYFEAALSYDPDVPNGELYLGLSYSQQFIPGVDTPENNETAERAIEVLGGLLEKEPLNATAIAALASIYQNRLELQKARDYYLLQTEATPDDPVAFYSVGSINWIIITAPGQSEALGDQDKMELIRDGQEYLDRALELDPSYEDAAVYKNLLYRQEALLIPEDTEDEAEIARRDELVAQADQWFERAMEIREQNAERAASGLSLE